MPPGPIVEGGEQDALIQVRCWSRNRQGPKQTKHASAASDLRRAGGATLDVGRQARGVGREEVIEQEEIDELAGACAIQGVADVRVRHIRYMT
jgi:hypothetical protein